MAEIPRGDWQSLVITFTDASDYVFNTIAHDAAGDELLTVTLTRFAVYCANLPGALTWLELFHREFILERGRLRLERSLSKELRSVTEMIEAA